MAPSRWGALPALQAGTARWQQRPWGYAQRMPWGKGSKNSYCLISSRNLTPWLWYGRSWCHHLQGATGDKLAPGAGAPTAAKHPRIHGLQQGGVPGGRGIARAGTEGTDGTCPPGRAKRPVQRSRARSRSIPQPSTVTLGLSHPRTGRTEVQGTGDRPEVQTSPPPCQRGRESGGKSPEQIP